MLRGRRYRSFVIFSVIFGLVFLQFLRSRNWSDNWPGATPDLNVPPPVVNHDSTLSSNSAPDDKFHSDLTVYAPSVPHEQSLNDDDYKQPPINQETPEQKELVDDEKWNTEIVQNPPTQSAPTHATPDYSEEVDFPSISTPGLGVSEDVDTSEVPKQVGTKGKPAQVELHPPATTPTEHWRKLPEHFPIADEDVIRLPTGRPKSLPKLQSVAKEETTTEKLLRTQRLAAIKEEFEHAWDGYTEYALGHDEIRPVSGNYKDPFAGWGATLVDALDTLWIMGLKDEFVSALDEVKKIDFTTTFRADIPVFETVIRYLGGFLGAYDISGQKYTILLDKAEELAEILMGAFDTPNRMPMTFYNWAPAAVAQPHRARTRAVLAEIGSLSMEFTRLAQITHKDRYYDAIARITNELEIMQNNTKLPGMWPLAIDASGCKPVDNLSFQKPSHTDKSGIKANEAIGREIAKPSSSATLPQHLPIPKDMEKRDTGLEADAQPADYETDPPSTVDPSDPFPKNECVEQGLASPPNSHSDKFGLGGQSDSTYEYLPKEYMLLGGLSDQYRSLYEISMGPVRENLIFRPMLPDEERDIRFVATVSVSDSPLHAPLYAYEGTHLTCFAGGMFALGAKLFGLDDDMDIAAKLTDGCVWAYESTTTGIMPEGFEILPCDNLFECPWNETRWLDIMDPNQETRIQQAEKSYQRKLLRAKEAYLESLQQKKPNIVTPMRNSAPEKSEPISKESHAGIAKRDNIARASDDYDEHALLSTSRNNVVEKAEPNLLIELDDDPNFVPPPMPPVLSHEDYVAARVKEERIPLGYTKIQARKYILRPEAIESVFYMYRLTGDDIWREKGWKMFEAIARHCRTGLADSAISDVTSIAPQLLDEMESFWLAETLKYFYLLFSDPSVVNLDEYVLNTEAHPFKIPKA